MKIEVNQLKTIQDVVKYLEDYTQCFDIPDTDIIKCVSVLREYADQQQPVVSDEEINIFHEVIDELGNYADALIGDICMPRDLADMLEAKIEILNLIDKVKILRDNYQPKQTDLGEILKSFIEFTDQSGIFIPTWMIDNYIKSKLI